MMNLLKHWFVGSLFAILISCSTAYAQSPFDLVSTTETLTGQAYSLPGDKALAVRDGNLWYMRRHGQASPPPALFLGLADEIDSAPLPWSELVTETYFGSDPLASPTGDPVMVSRFIEAVIYELDGPNFTGYAVGLVQRITYSSGTASDSIDIVDPGALVFGLWDAYELFDRLTIEPRILPPGPDDSCADKCQRDYNTAVDKAYDDYLTNMRTVCTTAGLGGGFVTGCTLGAAVCGWLIPPASTLACCAMGGILGSAAGFGSCAYIYTEQYQNALRDAERDYVNCMLDCGYVIVWE